MTKREREREKHKAGLVGGVWGWGTLAWTLTAGVGGGVSRVIRRCGWNQRPGKNLFNYRYRGRLETDSVVGELVEKRG